MFSVNRIDSQRDGNVLHPLLTSRGPPDSISFCLICLKVIRPTTSLDYNHNDAEKEDYEDFEELERILEITVQLFQSARPISMGLEPTPTLTPHAFINRITRSSTKVAGAVPKLESQYCVNIAAAMVNVTMLMQFATLSSSVI